MNYKSYFTICLLLFVLVHCTLAQHTIHGTLLKTLDGDTFTMMDTAGTLYKIRLTGVDAPERGQVCDTAATQQLQSLLEGQQLCIEYSKTDRYRRIVALVYTDSCNVNESMLTTGYAWAYTEYLEKSILHYTALEERARVSKLGLWVDPKAIAPWVYRK